MMSKREELALKILPKDRKEILIVSPQSPEFYKEIEKQGNKTVIDKKAGVDVCTAHQHFKKNSFDSAIMLDVLEHIKQPRRALHALQEVVKPGGSIIISVPLASPTYNLLDLQRLIYHHRYTEYEITHLLWEGFGMRETETYGNKYNAYRNFLHALTGKQFFNNKADCVPGDYGIVIRCVNGKDD